MESKNLLTGIICFIAGALLVATAATTFNKPGSQMINSDKMASMDEGLKDKFGAEFDKEFIVQMITHHQDALKMAQLAEKRAEHKEIKQLSTEIIRAQQKEISTMQQWQKAWGYDTANAH